jgi:hypothetical protein
MQGLDYNNENPKGWYMSEKLDGIRAYWNGKEFLSKRGFYFNDLLLIMFRLYFFALLIVW